MARTNEQLRIIARLQRTIDRVDEKGTLSDDTVLIADPSLIPLPGTDAPDQLRVGDLRDLLALIIQES